MQDVRKVRSELCGVWLENFTTTYELFYLITLNANNLYECSIKNFNGHIYTFLFNLQYNTPSSQLTCPLSSWICTLSNKLYKTT